MSKTTVHLMAFDFNFSKNITMDDFHYWMEMLEKQDIKANGYTCKIMSTLKDGYIVGLILSYKGDKKILATRDDKSELVIDKISLTSDQNSTQASVFCIEPTSQSGMFYSYHNGIAVGLFGEFFKKIHDKSRLEKIKSKQVEKPNKNQAKIKSEFFPGEFNLHIKSTKADMEFILENMSDVNSVDITMGPAVDPAPMFRSLIPFANKFSTKISLEGKQSATNKIGAVRTLLKDIEKQASLISYKVRGKNLTGRNIDFKMGENVEHFGEYNLDDFIEMLPAEKWIDFTDCGALNVLMEKMKKNVAVFKKPSPIESWKFKKTKAELIKEYLEEVEG